jgi:hypothetical protein
MIYNIYQPFGRPPGRLIAGVWKSIRNEVNSRCPSAGTVLVSYFGGPDAFNSPTNAGGGGGGSSRRDAMAAAAGC